MKRWPVRVLKALCFAVALLVMMAVAAPARAHLMPVGKGTINVVGSKAYVVFSLPLAAFASDDFRATTLSRSQLNRSEQALRARVRAGVQLTSADQTATFEQVLLSLPTGAGHDDSHAEDLLVMLVAKFPSRPTSLSLSSDLWADADGTLLMKATFSEGETVVRADVGELSQGHPTVVFFASAGQVLSSSMTRGLSHMLGGADHVVFVVLMLLLGIDRRRWLRLMGCVAASFVVAFWITSQGLGASPWVEVAIAVSVVVMALSFRAPKRIAKFEMTLVAGLSLLHGLGFAATATGESASEHLPWMKLVGVNLGAGAGQLLIALAVGVALVVGKRAVAADFERKLVPLVPVAGAALGIYWTAARTLMMLSPS